MFKNNFLSFNSLKHLDLDSCPSTCWFRVVTVFLSAHCTNLQEILVICWQLNCSQNNNITLSYLVLLILALFWLTKGRFHWLQHWESRVGVDSKKSGIEHPYSKCLIRVQLPQNISIPSRWLYCFFCKEAPADKVAMHNVMGNGKCYFKCSGVKSTYIQSKM